ncbi:hypothetical protein PVL29_014034 [Vitis rotundifolia]|uniref:Uncharacterized protein n=1 Tax=Vitis rotundifolia TaxID=103349 RepID=A0AA38ZFI1_VITRO|nr:hypothetical protein PVL29_014034 [Vitis rotundifolia]
MPAPRGDRIQDCMDSEASDFFRLAKVIEGCRFGDSLSLLQKLYQQPVVPIGLLPTEVNDSEGDESWGTLRQWLYEKTENSVLYVALGTELTLKKSGLPFVWVVKTKDDPFITGFEARQILAHPSVGGFLTHCGWSSVIEALGLGRVLVLFPGAFQISGRWQDSLKVSKSG